MTNNVQKIREELGLTRVAFAKKVGIGYSTLCNYEYFNKNPNLENCYKIIKLCEQMNIPITVQDIRPPKD